MTPTSRSRLLARLALGAMAALAVVSAAAPAQAQLDTTHWLPAPWSAEHDSHGIGDHWLYITTPEVTATAVTVRQADGATLYTGVVSNDAPLALHLGQWSTSSSAYQPLLGLGHLTYENAALNAKHAHGLIIEAARPVYVNIRNRSTAQGTSLTAKGKKALGYEFRVAVMRASNSGKRYHGVFLSVMATQPGTTEVTIDDVHPGLVLTGNTGVGSPPTTAPIVVTLDQYETYIVGIRNLDHGLGGVDINEINGTRVRATKPVAVVSGTWLGGNTSDGGRDVGIDQLAPTNLAGSQYILMKGNADTDSLMEVPTVVAVENDTQIFLRDDPTPTFTLNAGDWAWIHNQYHPTHQNLLVTGTKPFLMFQTIGGSNNDATPGFNFIPPLGAGGEYFVDNIADVTYLGTATAAIVARKAAKVTVNGVDLLASAAADVEGTTEWVTYRVPASAGELAVSSDKTIAVALFTVSNNIGAAGYFSGFPAALVDLDFDGVPDGEDNCPDAANPRRPCSDCALPQPGCDLADPALVQCDADGDGVGDACELCPLDPNKTAPGQCGCGEVEVLDPESGLCFQDQCPDDPDKHSPGVCGCGVPDTDTDGDGTPDCIDECPDDAGKTNPGVCGCGVVDADNDGDLIADCFDNCPDVQNPDQADCDGDGVGAACSDGPTECCADGGQDTNETDVDCGGPACAPCAYGGGCEDGGDCESGVCVDGVCGCATDADCAVAQVCDTGASQCVGCLLDEDCAGFGAMCGPETCVDRACAAEAPICEVPVFYGVVVTPGGALGSVRCYAVSGAPPECDMAGDALAIGPPMCGG